MADEPAHLSQVWEGDDRPTLPRLVGEKEALTAYLDRYRRTIELKCWGLDADGLNNRSMPPSTMSLHGLLRHLAGVERWWLQINFAKRDVPMLFYTDEQPDLDFDPTDDDPQGDLAIWRAECETSRAIVDAADLEQTSTMVVGGDEFNLRWLMLRMITEYAQHCGHADLLRQGVDGRTGA